MHPHAHDRYKDTIDFLVATELMAAGTAYGAIADFEKPAGERCPHQRHSCGCKVYPRRPMGCQLWQCGWLADEPETAGMRRPDKVHYVIDISPDFVRGADDRGEHVIPVVQIWADPNFRAEILADQALRAYIKRRCAQGYSALIRFDNAQDALFLHWNGERWIEKNGGVVEHEHTAGEKVQAIARAFGGNNARS